MSIPESALNYGSILTLLGENAEINGKLNNKPINFTHIAIGDGNDQYVQPSRTQTTLVNEITRIPVTGMEKIEPSEEGGIPQLKVWAKIPDNIVDVAVREFAAIAVYDGNSYLHAVGNSVRIPILSGANNGGEVNDIYIEMTFAVTSLDPIIMIDPSIVTATRKYVDDQDAKHVDESDPHTQYERKDNAASDNDIDTDSSASKHIKLPQLWRAFSQKLYLGFSANLGDSGYIKFPDFLGGFIIQWVMVNTDVTGDFVASLPIAFPNALLGGIVAEEFGWAGDSSSSTIWAFNKGTSNTAQIIGNCRWNVNGGSVYAGEAGGIAFVWGK
ncbi:phage tail protein [Vibrio fluvialis]